ncbi:MAG: CvpA family protein [Sphingobacteriales bacterium]|nr:MAG: CvpA family protein [Sphingobacteriales bacterium]
MGLTTLDILIALTLAYAAWKGWRRGILMSLLYLVGTLLGLVMSLKFSGEIGEWFVRNGYAFGAKSTTAGFVVTFIGMGLLMRLAARTLHGVLRATGLTGINRALGAGVQVLIFALVWSCLLWLGSRTTLIPLPTVKGSVLFPVVEPLAPYLFSKIGVILPFVKSSFTELSVFIDSLKHS